MATLEEAKAAFNTLTGTDSPDPIRTAYSDYRIIENEFYAAGWSYAAYRDIFEFQENEISRYLAAEWSVLRNGYTEEQVPPNTRAYECQKNVYGDTVTYTEIL